MSEAKCPSCRILYCEFSFKDCPKCMGDQMSKGEKLKKLFDEHGARCFGGDQMSKGDTIVSQKNTSESEDRNYEQALHSHIRKRDDELASLRKQNEILKRELVTEQQEKEILKRELKEANHRKEKAQSYLADECKAKMIEFEKRLKLQAENSALKELVREAMQWVRSEYYTQEVIWTKKAKALIGGDDEET